MAAVLDLIAEGFHPSPVVAKRLNIQHPDPLGLGPFCRLTVTTSAPLQPGVYVWVVDGEVKYVGLASYLPHVVNGARMQRAYNDYTYVPASKVAQTSSPRVRVNGLLNKVLHEGAEVSWWWRTTSSLDEAKRTEAALIAQWEPLWNRARPVVT
jgi:hypothetical protein